MWTFKVYIYHLGNNYSQVNLYYLQVIKSKRYKMIGKMNFQVVSFKDYDYAAC